MTRTFKIGLFVDCIITFFEMGLIVLKLFGVIDWNWGLVLIPAWVDLGVFITALIYKCVRSGKRI